MKMSHSDGVAQTERALLGSILLDNSLWTQTTCLSVDDFLLDSHRKIFGQMVAMFEDGFAVDPTILCAKLDGHLEPCGGPAYISSLLDDAFPENISNYVRILTEAGKDRRFSQLCRQLSHANADEERFRLLLKGQELLKANAVRDWRSLFHTHDEIVNAPQAKFAIQGFLQEEGITLIGGLAGHGKTLCMLAMVRALLEGGKLFHHFPVNQTAKRVLYLIPEAGLSPFATRLRTFRLEEHIRAGRLFCRTLSAQGQLLLSDPRMLEAARGADVFLDTAIRFMTGDENNAAEQKLFAQTLFDLQHAGARTITGAHHSPKSFGKDTIMTLENVLRGSGDIGAMLATCWGLSQVDAVTNRIYLQNVKARDFMACEPFIIQGRPSIDRDGYFELTHPPGFAGSLGDNKAQAGRPETPDKERKIAEALRMKEAGRSYQQIADELGISKGTVSKWTAVS